MLKEVMAQAATMVEVGNTHPVESSAPQGGDCG